MTALPAIRENGYELCAVAQFLRDAPAELVARYRRELIGRGSFVIWDPNDGEHGLLLCAPSVAALNAAFLEARGEWLGRCT